MAATCTGAGAKFFEHSENPAFVETISNFLTAVGFEILGFDQWQRRFNYPATGESVITVDTDKCTILSLQRMNVGSSGWSASRAPG